MNNLRNYIINELKDETYFNLASKKYKNKNIDNIISHSYNVISKNFIDELTKKQWYNDFIIDVNYNDNKKLKSNSFKDDDIYTLKLTWNKDLIKLDNSLWDDQKYYYKRGSTGNDILEDIIDDCSSLCKKYNRFIHGFEINVLYHEILFKIFDRKKYIKDIDEDTILYHLVDNKNTANKILENGLKCKETVNFNQNRYNQYTYNCVFAFREINAAINYAKYINNDEHIYYLIKFKAGNNIFFNDHVFNDDAYECNKKAVFTLTDINKDQIISVDQVNFNNYKSIKKLIKDNS